MMQQHWQSAAARMCLSGAAENHLGQAAVAVAPITSRSAPPDAPGKQRRPIAAAVSWKRRSTMGTSRGEISQQRHGRLRGISALLGADQDGHPSARDSSGSAPGSPCRLASLGFQATATCSQHGRDGIRHQQRQPSTPNNTACKPMHSGGIANAGRPMTMRSALTAASRTTFAVRR